MVTNKTNVPLFYTQGMQHMSIYIPVLNKITVAVMWHLSWINKYITQHSCMQTQNQSQGTWSQPWLWSSIPGWNMSSEWWQAMPSGPEIQVHLQEELELKKQVNPHHHAQHLSHIVIDRGWRTYTRYWVQIPADDLLWLESLAEAPHATSWLCYIPIVNILSFNWARSWK